MKRVLFPTDLTNIADTILGHAMFHAEAHDCELHILHAITWKDGDPTEFLPDADTLLAKREEAAKVLLAEHLEPHKDRSLNIVEQTRRNHNPAEAILEYIEEHAIDMVVMGNHGRSGISHFFLGSVAEEVVRLAKAPVLVIRANAPRIDVRPIKKILAPVDFSKTSRRAFQEACAVAKLHGSALTAYHVIQNTFSPVGPEPCSGALCDVSPDLERSRADLLNSLACDPEVSLDCHVEIGSAYHAIAEYAERDESDMIVLGSHGYSGLAHLVLGSTAERIMRMAPCPVLVIKGCDKEAVDQAPA